jgi:hypothetical protein
VRRWPALVLLVALAACHRQPAANQATRAAPVVNLSDARRVPAPASGVGSAALPAPELDGVATAAGNWRFQVSADGDQAVFGSAGQPSEFAMRCDAAARRMVFTRVASAGTGKTMQIVAADGAATFYVEPGAAGRIQASDPAMDTFLTDVLAGAKDRIGVKIGSGVTFAMPVDPVIAQTIKRCAAPKV